MTPQRDFARLLKPRAIAVVGASADISRIGGQPIPVLIESGFSGGIYPVNPKYPKIGDEQLAELQKAKEELLNEK